MKATLSWNLWNFKDAVQFQTAVLAVEIDEPPTKKIRDCGAKETQLSLILVIVASCWLVFQHGDSRFALVKNLSSTCRQV